VPVPYNALGYQPEMASHGTHVMDIAAGNGGGSNVPGVAPEADMIFVHVDSSDVPWSGADVVGRNFGDSVHLLEALRFIFNEAGERPCVINVSLGTNGGPHDGTTLVEKGIDSMLREKSGRAVVIAAANSFADQIHAHGEIEVGGMSTLGWELKGNQRTENEMEIWGRISVKGMVDTLPEKNGAETVSKVAEAARRAPKTVLGIPAKKNLKEVKATEIRKKKLLKKTRKNTSTNTSKKTLGEKGNPKTANKRANKNPNSTKRRKSK